MLSTSSWKPRAAVIFALLTLAGIGYYVVTNWRAGPSRSWFGF